MKDIVEKIRQILCNHYWATHNYWSKDLRTMGEYRKCVKCGKVDG